FLHLLLCPPHPLRSPLYFLTMTPPPPRPTLFPYTTLFRSAAVIIALPGSGTNVTLNDPSLSAYCAGGPVKLLPSTSPRYNRVARSEEHTSELQSRSDLVCRLLLEKKKMTTVTSIAQQRRTG